MFKPSSIFIVITVFILALLVLVLVFILPALRQIKEAAAQISTYQSDLVLLENQHKEFLDFRAKQSAYVFDLEKINSLFVDTKNPIVLIQFIEDVARKSSVDIQINIQPSLSGQKSVINTESLLLSIAAKGSFGDIYQFLQKLEYGPYLINVKRASIKKTLQTNQNPANALEANFFIEAQTK